MRQLVARDGVDDRGISGPWTTGRGALRPGRERPPPVIAIARGEPAGHPRGSGAPRVPGTAACGRDGRRECRRKRCRPCAPKLTGGGGHERINRTRTRRLPGVGRLKFPSRIGKQGDTSPPGLGRDPGLPMGDQRRDGRDSQRTPRAGPGDRGTRWPASGRGASGPRVCCRSSGCGREATRADRGCRRCARRSGRSAQRPMRATGAERRRRDPGPAGATRASHAAGQV